MTLGAFGLEDLSTFLHATFWDSHYVLALVEALKMTSGTR